MTKTRFAKHCLLALATTVLVFAGTLTSSVQAASSDYGKIDVDTGKIGSNKDKSVSSLGIPFVNKLIMFSASIASIALLFVIIINGIKIINTNKGPDALVGASKNISISILGLLIASMSFVLTTYAGTVLFGSGDFFLDPVASIRKAAPVKSSDSGGGSSCTDFFCKLKELISSAEGYIMMRKYVPTSGQVFGTPKPIATGGVGAQDASAGVKNLIGSTVGLLAMAASVWLLVAIIWNGYKIITSQKSEVLSQAIRNISISLAGFLIAVLSYVIASYVVNRLYGNTQILEGPVEVLPT